MLQANSCWAVCTSSECWEDYATLYLNHFVLGWRGAARCVIMCKQSGCYVTCPNCLLLSLYPLTSHQLHNPALCLVNRLVKTKFVTTYVLDNRMSLSEHHMHMQYLSHVGLYLSHVCLYVCLYVLHASKSHLCHDKNDSIHKSSTTKSLNELKTQIMNGLPLQWWTTRTETTHRLTSSMAIATGTANMATKICTYFSLLTAHDVCSLHLYMSCSTTLWAETDWVYMQNMEHLPAQYCYQNVTHNFRPQNSDTGSVAEAAGCTQPTYCACCTMFQHTMCSFSNGLVVDKVESASFDSTRCQHFRA